MPNGSTRIDPTRSIDLRREFMVEVSKRFDQFAREVLKLVYTDDAFGLRSNRTEVLVETPLDETSVFNRAWNWVSSILNARWKFNTDQEKVERFREWVGKKLHISPKRTPDESQWWDRYIEKAYKKGVNRGTVDGRAAKGLPKPPDLSVRQFNKLIEGETLKNKLHLLAGRTFTDLKGVNDDMSMKLTRILTDGLARNLPAEQMARNMVRQVGVSKQRALTIARTEITHAHAEGQLDALEDLGFTHVGVNVEWQTAANPCKACSIMKGMIIPIEKARGMIPRHPNCRCAWAAVEIPPESPARVRGRVNRSIKQDIPKSNPRRSVETQKRISGWQGATLKKSQRKKKSK